tara:strand:- start:1229 stop:1501 length:273 start_codon:yes stop_codon:yes gene_type:complete
MHIAAKVRLGFLSKVKKLKLSIPPVKLDIKLIKPKRSGRIILNHHNYPLDEPIIVQKRDDDMYLIRDGHHRYQQALDLNHTEILSIIIPS